MDSFEYTSKPSKVIFGSGTISQLPGELQRLGFSKPILVSTPRQTHYLDQISKLLTECSVTRFTDAVIHTPVNVTEKATQQAQEDGADCLVSFGGGSAIGLGKAVSYSTGLYHITIPSTYSGNEVTTVLGQTKDGVKSTLTDDKVLPGTVIYDVDFTLSLPREICAVSGVNAIAHAVEALYAQKTNPIVAMFAEQGVKALAASLPRIVQGAETDTDTDAVEARNQALYGAWLCGTCLAGVNMALHHKLCHALGGTLGLPHAETHTIVLPHVVAYNAPKVKSAMDKLAHALPDSQGDAVKGLNVLLKKLRVKRALKDLGMKEDDVDKVTSVATKAMYWNPREVTAEGVREIIRRAWAGEDARGFDLG